MPALEFVLGFRAWRKTAAGEMLRIYNEWLADFCPTHPDR